MPCTNIKLEARTDRRFIRSTYRSNRFILAEVTAPHAHERAPGERRRPPVNLAFVLDRSGSMAGEKLRLAKLAVEQSIVRLQPDDRFAVVVYDDSIDVIQPSVTATPGNRQAAMSALSRVESRGTTNLGEGWLRGCEQVAKNLQDAGVNRCLLLTDGLANVGMTDPDELATHAVALRTRGVSTTTFGVGTDFNEVLLQAMATAGGGNFYYIAEVAQITDIITSEVGEALDVVARDVTLEIDTPEGVMVETLSPFAVSSLAERTVVSLGPLVAEQVAQVVLRLNFPFGEMGRETGAVLSLSAAGDRDGVASGASTSLTWEYADGKMNDLQPRDVDVDRAVARVFASRARQEATGLNRVGQFPAARAALLAVAKRIRAYAGADAEMRTVVAELERDATEVAAPMPAASIKDMHFRAYASAKMRTVDGRAMRLSDRDDS